MQRGHVIVFVCLVTLGISSARAQQEHYVLQFEFSRDGQLFAKPELILESGRIGRINLESDDAPNAPRVKGLHERIEVTPTVQSEKLSMVFDIKSADKRFQPALVISKDLKGSFEWKSSEGEAIRMTVSWVE